MIKSGLYFTNEEDDVLVIEVSVKSIRVSKGSVIEWKKPEEMESHLFAFQL